MSEQPLIRVLTERERLRARIEQQRDAVDRYAAGLSAPAAVIDRVRLAGRFVRAHPGVVLAVMGAGVVLRARSLPGLLARGLGIWRLARQVRILLRYVGY